MKSVQPYLPAILLALAAIAGVYLFYFKPKQDKAKAAQLAAQAAADNDLIKYTPLFGNAKISTQALSTKAQSISSIL